MKKTTTKKEERKRKEEILKARKNKKREKPMLTRCPGLFFLLLQTVNLRAGTYADDDKKRIQQAHAAAGRPKTVPVAGGGK